MIGPISSSLPVKAGGSSPVAAIVRPRASQPGVPVYGDRYLTGSPDFLKYFTRGNKVEALFDKSVTPDEPQDEIFFNVKQGICNAKSSIQLEMFGFGQPILSDLLIAKARSGVKVQVVLDPVTPGDSYEKAKDSLSKEMVAGGVDVRWYPVQNPAPGHKFAQIDHVKMLLLDGQQAIIGGMNWDAHSPENHDVDVKVEGPAVNRMQWLFARDYVKSGGDKASLPPISPIQPRPDGDSLVSLATASEDTRDRSIRATLFRNIDNATQSIEAELFCITDPGLRQALIHAHQRGVNVKLLVNPLEIRGNHVNERTVGALRKAGVEVRWYVPNLQTRSRLHAKMAVFDHDETVLGSANWSGNGLTWNHEADVDVIDPAIAAQYSYMFREDWLKGSDTPQYLPDVESSPTP